MRELVACALLLGAIGSPISDIGGFLAGGWNKLKDFAGQVWKSFRRLWAFITGILHNVGGAWDYLHGAIRTLVRGLEELAEGTYKITRWLVNTVIPKRIRVAIGKIGNLVYNKAKALFDLGRKQLRKAFTFLQKLVNKAWDWSRKAVKGIWKKLNKAINWINKAGKKVADLVLHPKRLADWIVPHLVTPIARWILKHLTSLATLILKYFLHNVGKFANDIERAISKIF